MSDLRHALRGLRKNPGFSAVAAVTLGLGIGANTAIFSLVHGVLIQPLPFRDPGGLVALSHTAPGLGIAKAGQSEATFLHYQQRSQVLDDLAFYYENVVNVNGEAGPERVPVAMVSPSFFSLLGASPAAGRLFTREDATRREVSIVVLSYGLWKRQFGSDPAIVGRRVLLNNAPREVVGVVEPGFGFPRRQTEIWYADTPDAANPVVSVLAMSAIARLKPGISVEEAERELNQLIPSLPEAYPRAAPFVQQGRPRAVVTPLKDEIVGDVGTALWVLLGAVGFVLLIACANVANLFLVRAEHRHREVAVRTALGARRADLARSFLGESVVIGTLGGTLGVAIADAAVRALVVLGPENIPRLHEVRLGGEVLAFATGLSMVTALALGALTTLRFAALDVVPALKEGLRAASAGPARARTRRVLVASQMALALTLLAGAGLMVRSFWRLKNVDPGFDARGVLTLEIALSFGRYPDYEAAARLWYGLLERVRALPGVEAAGTVSDLPLRGETMKRYMETPLTTEGSLPEVDTPSPMVGVRLFTPGYFEAMRIPVVLGRGLDLQGRADEATPVLVSATLARQYFGQETAVGKRVAPRRLSSPRDWNTVVGVVGDVRDLSIQEQPPALLYLPVLERSLIEDIVPTHMSLAIRASVSPLSLVGAVRDIVRELEPDLPIANVLTMDRIVADAMARTSFAMLLLLVAAGVAISLAAVGIYGVVSYTVSQRTREIGVRVALGALPGDISALVLRQGSAAMAVGLGLGLMASLLLTRFLGSLLYEVRPTDPVTLAAASGLLLGIALLANYLPSRRAARVDPMVVLRYE